MRELCDSAVKDAAQQNVSLHANFVVTLKCIVYPSHWKVGYTWSRLVSKEIRKYIILCNLLAFFLKVFFKKFFYCRTALLAKRSTRS